MPRKMWRFLFWAITIPFFLGGQLILADAEHFGTRDDWLAGIIGAYALLIVPIYCFFRKGGKGSITGVGLERENESAIPLPRVEQIVNEGARFPSVVFFADDQVKLYIAGIGFVKLAKTRLNQWMINGEELTVLPGEDGRELRISYAPLGMYYRLEGLVSWLSIFFFCTLVIHVAFNWDISLPSNTSLVLIICLGLLSSLYRRVKVTVEGDRVVLKRGKKEESFRFGDVVSMEKGLFQVKVMLKDGKVFFFPRGCILLPEIIEDFAGLADR